MSEDEIVFDDLKYREPERRRRPDRDRRWACLAYEVPGSTDLPIFLDFRTADAIERHALRDTSVELGGILLGKECLDDQTGEPFVWVTNALEARHYENTQASFTYTHDSWEEISRERDATHPDLDIVGWYHTHPDFGIFLSGHDLFIHHHFFAQPLQVAYVVDPIRQTRGFFQWRDGQMAQVGGFTLTGDRANRLALSRLANELEHFPNPEGAGGGISPRLEAELIAMLSRPSAHSHSGSADRAQSAALFVLIGGLLGVVGLSALLWLNQMHNQVAEQTKALAAMEEAVRISSERQRVVFDSVAGRSADDFRALYSGTAKALDESRAKLSNQESVNDALASQNTRLTAEVEVLRSRLQVASKQATDYEFEAKEAKRLRPQMENLKEDLLAKTHRLIDLDEIFDSPEGREAVALKGKYDRAWMLAAGGWSVAAVLAMIAVGGYAMLRSPKLEEPEVPIDGPDPNEPPTHRIV